MLADEMGVSLRTLYRDIASLQAQGATIEGEAGVGYVLKPGFMLPPYWMTTASANACGPRPRRCCSNAGSVRRTGRSR